jgi:hypothetical protein
MATHEVWLGPSGSEVLLPPPSWLSDSPGEYPQEFKRNIESATMLDGRKRFNFYAYCLRAWTLSWAWLTLTDKNTIEAVATLKRSLRFSSGLTAQSSWRTVAVKKFGAYPILSTFPSGSMRYRVELELEEENNG